MSSDAFGKLFTLTTAGESHGELMMGIIGGCPPGLALSVQDLQSDLDRRKPGTTPYTSARFESDCVQLVSGVFEGVTTGTPIGLIIRNDDARSRDYDDIKSVYRPGHADYTYDQKYGRRDYRGGGRSSARETALWVAAGAIAKKYMYEVCGLKIQGYVSSIGDIKAQKIDLDSVNDNSFFFADASRVEEIAALIKQLRRDGDSIGAKVHVLATSVPVGLGAPVFNKLDAAIAHAMMGINAVKGVEIGDGMAVAAQRGSEHRDEMTPEGFLSNHAGGVLGGISTGQSLRVSLAIKPAASIRIPGQTLNTAAQPVMIKTKGRHDPCVGIRAVPIAEAMLACVLMDHFLIDRAQNSEVKRK